MWKNSKLLTAETDFFLSTSSISSDRPVLKGKQFRKK